MPSASQHLEYLKLPTVRAWLDTIAWAEGGRYNNRYGNITFSGNQHPNTKYCGGGYCSEAAGRYQFLYSTWRGIQSKLGLSDFSPVNQDIAALELTAERGALGYVLNGDLIAALKTLGCAWAALPYSTCKQKMRGVTETVNYYNSRLKYYQGGNTVNNSVNPVNNAPVNNVLPVLNTQTKDNGAMYILGALGIIILLKL
jgi:muramidase (phage lysozyme)